MRKIPVILLLAFFAMPAIYGQIKIGDNPQAISPTSVLELESNDRVLVITRVTTAQMNAIVPLQGALVYNTELQSVHYYDGTQWVNIGGGGTSGALTADPIVNDVSTIVITPNGGADNLEVAPNSIGSLQIINGGINGVDIQNGSIGPGKLQDQSVTQNKLSENSVGAFALDNANIDLGDFSNGPGFITGADIVSGDAGNNISVGGDNGAFYDDQTLQDDIAANTTAINNIGVPNLDEVLQQGANAGNQKIEGLATPTNPADAVTKAYVDGLTGGGSDDQNLASATLNPANNELTIAIENGNPVTVDLDPLAGGGGTTEVADQTTITGVGTAGDPFTIEPGANDQILTTDGTGTVAWQTIAAGGSTEEADQTTITGIGTNADPFKIEPSATNGQFLVTDATGNVAWETSAPGGSTEEADQTTITGIGTNADPFKIEPSATNGQFLVTDATGNVAWETSAPGGSTELADQVTITGNGQTGTEFQVADSGINTLQLADDAVTLDKIAPPDPAGTPAPADGQIMAWDNMAGEWVIDSQAGEHSGPGMSLFFADATTELPTTAFNPNNGGTAETRPSLIWDQTQRVNSGALGIGLDGTPINGNVKVHIIDAVSGNVSYPLEVHNRTTSAGSGTGILFASDSNNDGKGALVFERQGGFGVGDFHFLLNTNNVAAEAPDLASDKAFTVKNNKDIQLYGGIDINGIGTGGANEVLTADGAGGISWGAAGGGTDNQQLTLAAGNMLTLEDGGTPIDLSLYLDDQNAAQVTVAATPTNYTAATPDVEAHLAGINTALAGGSTDNQQLTLATGNMLTLEDGGTPIDLSPYLDNQTAGEVAVTATPTNYTATTPDVEAHLAGINTALASGGLNGTAAGSIFFSGDATPFAATEDNAQLFWDNADNKLYVGPQTVDADTDVKMNVGGTTRTQGIKNSAGSAGLPSYRFTDDLNSGMFLPAGGDQLGLSSNGAEAIRIDNNQNVGIGTAAPTNAKLHVANGNLRLENGDIIARNGAATIVGQVLTNTINGTEWSAAGGLPAGGTNGQILSTNGAATPTYFWIDDDDDQEANDIDYNNATSGLAAVLVQDAINELAANRIIAKGVVSGGGALGAYTEPVAGGLPAGAIINLTVEQTGTGNPIMIQLVSTAAGSFDVQINEWDGTTFVGTNATWYYTIVNP